MAFGECFIQLKNVELINSTKLPVNAYLDSVVIYKMLEWHWKIHQSPWLWSSQQ